MCSAGAYLEQWYVCVGNQHNDCFFAVPCVALHFFMGGSNISYLLLEIENDNGSIRKHQSH